MGWDGEKRQEGERRTTREDFEKRLRSLAARVVMAVGSQSAEARDVVGVWEQEVLVANPRKNGRATRLVDGVRSCGRPPKYSVSVVFS
jgi:hypothetical protein